MKDFQGIFYLVKYVILSVLYSRLILLYGVVAETGVLLRKNKNDLNPHPDHLKEKIAI